MITGGERAIHLGHRRQTRPGRAVSGPGNIGLFQGAILANLLPSPHTLCASTNDTSPGKPYKRQLLKSDQARKRKEQYQQGKIETATASSAEVEPFLKLSRLHGPLTARPEGPPVLFDRCSLPVSPRGEETAEGKAASHGSTKHVTTEKHCNSGLSHSRSSALALAVTL